MKFVVQVEVDDDVLDVWQTVTIEVVCRELNEIVNNTLRDKHGSDRVRIRPLSEVIAC